MEDSDAQPSQEGKDKSLIVVVLVFFAGLLVIGIPFLIIMENRETMEQRQPVASEEGKEDGPLITKYHFDLITLGRTDLELVQRLWGPGELVSSNRLEDLKTERYEWRNPNGSGASLIFQNGVLISKSQYGLR